jgi:hypothetical protein
LHFITKLGNFCTGCKKSFEILREKCAGQRNKNLTPKLREFSKTENLYAHKVNCSLNAEYCCVCLLRGMFKFAQRNAAVQEESSPVFFFMEGIGCTARR